MSFSPRLTHQHKPMTIEDHRGRTLLKYDKQGNLLEERLPNQQTITYTRDIYGVKCNPKMYHNAEQICTS